MHRIGQNKPVTINRIVVNDSIENRVLSLQKEKRETANNALDRNRGNGPNLGTRSNNLRIADLVELFRD